MHTLSCALIPLLFISVSACGARGGDAAGGGPSSTASSGGTASTSSLRALLSPIGESLPRAQLEAIARFIRRFERSPYADPAENDTGMSTLAAILIWLTESPDVSVTICPFLSSLAESEGEGGDSGPATTMGSTFGMAAYLIEHPGADSTSREVQVAGAESALRWYRASLASRVATPNTFMDRLVQRAERDGGLGPFYDERQIHCGRSRVSPGG